MIQLCGVSKSTFDLSKGARFLLRDVTVSLPENSRVALLGKDQTSLTAALHLLAGSEIPDSGRIFADRIRRSPIINSGDLAGGALVPKLTGREHINFFSRVNGVDPIRLSAVVESACQLGKMLHAPVSAYDGPMRRAFEVTLIAALPYDCYFIDQLHRLNWKLLWQLLNIARGRGAGVIFTTTDARLLARHGQVGVVVENGSMHIFPQCMSSLRSK